MRSKFKYSREFNLWKREFSCAAKADNYVELLRPIEHLEVECSPKDMLACTIQLVRAVMGYCQLDGRECGRFLMQQRYRLDGKWETDYCLTFDLTGGNFGRVLTDFNFTFIDLADLFYHPWSGYGTAGFSELYITRIDGKRIGKRELKVLHDSVCCDMYNDNSEEDRSVDVWISDVKDTAIVSATEIEDYEDVFQVIRAAAFISRFGN